MSRHSERRPQRRLPVELPEDDALTRYCASVYCTTNLHGRHPEAIFCEPCWAQVTREQREAIVDAYVPGQHALGGAPPSSAWIEAVRVAINWIKLQREGTK